MSKEIYVPVGGKAQKVTKVYAPVNGVARSVKKVYKGVNGIARQVFEAIPPILPAFADNTWESVIAACQLGLVPDSWAVGDQIPMTIGGVEYLVDIIGKNHDDYADGSGKAPLTFQLHDLYATEYAMNAKNNNIGGWRDSDMRKKHMPAILALMPPEVQAGIREVNKVGGTGNMTSATATTQDKLFLLSEFEVYGRTYYSIYGGEGTQYAYYTNDNRRVKKINGVAADWWVRSPEKSSVSFICFVSSDGSAGNRFAGNEGGVAPAFCF